MSKINRRVLPRTALVVCLAAGLAGCGFMGADNFSNDRGKLVFGAHRLKIVPNGVPAAVVTKGPALTIAGQPVALDDTQRSDLAAYYTEAQQIHDRAAHIGFASVGLVGSVFANVGRAMVGDNGGQTLDQSINDRVSNFMSTHVGPICDRMANELQDQNRLKNALPAFAPYAIIGNEDIKDCRSNMNNDSSAATTSG